MFIPPVIVEYFLTAFTTLMVTVDPPGLAPIFLSLTIGMTALERRTVALRATIITAIVMTGFALFGQKFLGTLGIGFPAFRIAGGLLLFWIAFEMIFELRTRRKSSVARTAIDEDHIRNVAAFPLAIPLMAGPGTITATMLLDALSPDRLLWGSDWPWTQFEPGRSYNGVIAQCATLIPEYAASRAMDVAAMDLFRFSSAADYHTGFAARVA